MSIQRILIATDFSASARAAADRAARLAAEHGASLHLVHAMQRGGWLESLAGEGLAAQLRQQLDHDARVALDLELKRLGGTVSQVEGELLPGPLHQEIEALLDRRPAELLVMGTHGRAAWEDALLGSTADRMLRSHRLPILLVRGGADSDYRRLAIATDFSESSVQAARFARELLPGRTAILAHAHEPEFYSSLAYASVSNALRERYRSTAAEEAQQELQRFAAQTDSADAVLAFRQGHPAQVLPELIRESAVDIMVLGVSGRSGIERGLLGSVSRHAATALECDVLMVPRAD